MNECGGRVNRPQTRHRSMHSHPYLVCPFTVFICSWLAHSGEHLPVVFQGGVRPSSFRLLYTFSRASEWVFNIRDRESESERESKSECECESVSESENERDSDSESEVER